MEHIGKTVYVKELGEVGKVVNVIKNGLDMDVYKVDTESFQGWSCYINEMSFIGG